MPLCVDGLMACYEGLGGKGRPATAAQARSRPRRKTDTQTETEFRRRMEFLSQVPLFKRMPKA
eukprot:15083052-Heterocapsa_arctica.AAC.1